MSLVSFASDALPMRVVSTKLVVEPGARRTGKLAKVAYQFNKAYLFTKSHTAFSTCWRSLGGGDQLASACAYIT